LSAPGWTKIVANEEKARTATGNCRKSGLFNPGGKLGGVFIINAERKELQVVNIVGPIDLGKLAALGGILGIPGSIAAGLVQH
jgi:hypothetical protein